MPGALLAAPWYHLPDTRGIFFAALDVLLGLVTLITWMTSATMSGVFWADNPNHSVMSPSTPRADNPNYPVMSLSTHSLLH